MSWCVTTHKNTFSNTDFAGVFLKMRVFGVLTVLAYLFLCFSSTYIHHSLHISSYTYSLSFVRGICWYIVHSLIFITFNAQKVPKNEFFWVITVFPDLWDDENTYPQSPLTKDLVVLSEHNAKRILNQALANVQKKVR